jgi:hypothetical protein
MMTSADVNPAVVGRCEAVLITLKIIKIRNNKVVPVTIRVFLLRAAKRFVPVT